MAPHRFISSLQEHQCGVTVNVWLVTFWQMYLLAMNYFSCLSFCLNQSASLSPDRATRQGNPENHRCLLPRAVLFPCASLERGSSAAGGGSCSHWRDLSPTSGDRGRRDRGGEKLHQNNWSRREGLFAEFQWDYFIWQMTLCKVSNKGKFRNSLFFQ